MMWNDILINKLNIHIPIIQAPMAGGITTPTLVSEVAEAGALGFLAAGYLTAEQLEKQILEVKKRTNKIFGVNLFVVEDEEIEECIKPNCITSIEKELGIFKNTFVKVTIKEELNKKIELILKHNVKIVSFTFGVPSKEWIKKLKENEVYIIGHCTNLIEAKLLQEAQFDAIVAQGAEAGGHRSSFLNRNDNENDEIGLFSLLQEISSHIKISIIAAGGICSGKGILAAKILGASAVQIGTGFLLTTESGASEEYKRALLNSYSHETTFTKNISGKKARGKINSLISKLNDDDIKKFPIQNSLTKEIRNFAQNNKNSEYMSLWCGQSINMITEVVSVKIFIKNLLDEYKEELDKLQL